MRKTIFWASIVLFLGCEKNITTADVITDLSLSSHTIDADGTSTVEVSVVLNKKASADQRNVVFATSIGTWQGGSDTVIAKADFVAGKLTAKATLVAPLSPGKVIITVVPQTTSPNADYRLSDSLTADTVKAAAIKLSTTNFGLGANFSSIDTLTGTVSGAGHQKVSTGVRVIFEDQLTSSAKAGGRFRNNPVAVNSSSQVTGLYSAAGWPVGTDIRIIATILDGTGNKTGMADTLLLTINH